MITAEQFRAWLRKRRLNEYIDEVSSSLGVTNQAVWEWLSGRRNPGKQTLFIASLMMGKPEDLEPGLPQSRKRRR
jgi:transcriptional regulator with XRE-family HTH domain